jgi:hypothetical protein
MFEPKFIFGITMAIIYWSVGAMFLIVSDAEIFGRNRTLKTVFAIGIIMYGFFRLFKALKQRKENLYDRSEDDE